MKTDLKEKILDVCERLFLQRGVSETGVADIAKEAKISKGTLYYHFNSKDDLVDAVADRYFEKTKIALNQFMTNLVGGVPIETVLFTCVNVLTMKKTTEKMHYILLAYGVIKYPPLKEKFVQRYHEWQNMIYDALEGNKPNSFNELYSQLLLAIIDGLAIKNMIGMKTIEDKKSKLLEFVKRLNLGE